MTLTEDERKCEKFKSKFEGMKSHLMQVMEELKMRRKNDAENEEKMNKLITEKFELKKTKEEEICTLNDTIQNLKQENIQIHKVFEEKKKVHEEEKAAQSMTINSSGKGISALKDEILALQLTKFGLEKKLKDMEHQLQVEATSKNELTCRIKEVDKTVESMRNNFAQVNRRLDYLASLVVKTEDMHKKLIQHNEHQKTLLSNQRKEMMKCQKEISIKAALLKKFQLKEISGANKNSQHSEADEVMNKENANLKEQLEKEVESLRQQKKFLMTSLSETNQLLMSVQKKYEQSNDLNASLQIDLDEIKTSQMECTAKLTSSTMEFKSLQDELENERGKQKFQEESFDKCVQDYESKIAELRKDCVRIREKSVLDKEIQTVDVGQPDTQHIKDVGNKVEQNPETVVEYIKKSPEIICKNESSVLNQDLIPAYESVKITEQSNTSCTSTLETITAQSLIDSKDIPGWSVSRDQVFSTREKFLSFLPNVVVNGTEEKISSSQPLMKTHEEVYDEQKAASSSQPSHYKV